MKNSTFFDSGGGIRSTKRWFGLLTFFMMLFANQFSFAQCDIVVNVSSPGWGDQVSWELLDGNNTAVLSGGEYGNGYNDTQTTSAVNFPYTLVITIDDYWFFNCDNYANYTVTVGGDSIASGATEVACLDIITETIPISGPCPSCASPGALSIDDLTTSSADLHWVSDGTSFNIEWGVSGFELGTGYVGVADESTYSISGLSSSTTYQFYVNQDCVIGGQSVWAGPFSFTTPCDVFNLPFQEQFSAGVLPNCWTNTSSNAVANGLWKFAGTVDYATGNTKPNGTFAWVDGSDPNNMNDVTLTSPPIDVSSLTLPFVSFEYFSNNTNIYPNNIFTVQISDGSSWTTIYTDNTSQAGWREIEIPLTAFTGTTLQLRFIVDKTAAPAGYAFYNDILLDNVMVIEAPTCIKPIGLAVDAVMFNSVDLSWVSSGDLFDVEYGVTGFTPGDGITVTGVGNPYTVNGLAAETNYQYYVRQDCGVDGVSLWVGPYSFYTGYCLASSTSTGYRINGFSTNEGYTNILNLNNGVSNSYNNYSNYSVTQSEGGSFDYSVNVPGYTNVEIWIDWDNNMIFDSEELVAAHVYGTVVTTFTGTIDVPEGLEEGDYRIRVRSRYYSNPVTPCGSITYGETEDYTLSVVPAPSCFPPTELGISGATFTSADLIWTATGDLFNIEWGTTGFTLGDGTTVTGVGNPYTLNGLTAETNYQYYVRQDCGVDGVSLWAGPYSFYTGYCGVSTTNTSDYTSAFSTTGAVQNVNYTASSQPVGSYSNQSTQVIQQAQGLSFDFASTFVGGGNVINIWIDWNNDMIFDDSVDSEEKVYSFYVTGANQTGTITIPIDVPVGDYRVRVRSQWGSGNNPPPCGNVAYGSTVDFTLTVDPAPSCFPPTELGISGTTFTSADLIWTATGDLFNIEWGTTGFTPGDGTTVTGVGNPYTLNGLTAETHYQYYVQQDCGDGDVSYWSGPYSFYTGYCGVSTTNTSDYTSAFSTTGAVQNVNYTASSQPVGSYSDQSAQVIQQAQGLSFDFASTFVGGGNVVNIWIDWNNDMIFDDSVDSEEKVYSFYVTGADQTGTITIPIDVPVGDYRVRVRSQWGSGNNPPPCGNVAYGSTVDFTLTVIPAPSCFPPTELGVNGITFTSADLIWTATGDLFNIEWGTTGFTPGDGTTVTGVGNPYTLNGLTAETHYQYYVQQDCGDGDLSYWSGPYSFYTGYCLASSTSTGYRINGFSTNEGYTNILNLNNGVSNSYNNYSNYSVTQSEGGSFDYSVNVPGYTNVEIWIDWDNNMIFDSEELVAAHVYGTVVTTFTGTIDVPEGLEEGDYRIRVRSRYYYLTTANPCGTMTYGETEDYTLSVVPAPSCMPPSGLSAEMQSLTSAELHWNSTGTNFELEYGLQGFVLGTGTFVSEITSTSTVVTGLTSDVWYQYYVRQDCGDGDLSYWSGPYSFYTGYCGVSSTNTSDYITSFVTTGGIPFDISNTASGFSTGGYGNFTNMSVHHYETGSVDFTVTGNAVMGVNIWIDWNNNLEFEESEKVYASGATGTSFTGSITVPFGVPVGDYRMRVRGQWSNSNPEPCGSISWGEAEDYTFTVITPPSCLPPFAPTSINNSATSVSLSWQANGDLFDIEYGPVGFTPGTGTTISGVGNPYVLSGLESGVEYAYYVRQDCGEEDGSSTWNGPVAFTPGIYQGNIPTLLNSNPQVEDDACATSFSIEVPSGQYLSSLNVKYSMLSTSSAWTSQQRSVLYSPSLGLGEDVVVAGEIDFPGIQSYDRNVTFANGSTGTIEFQLKAWRTTGGTGCGTDRIYVIDESWILTPEFEDIPTCPDPATDLGYSNITEDSVDLIWEAESGSFQIIWDNAEFDPETEGTLVSGITTNSYTLSGLDSSVLYEFYVRRDCSSEEGEDFGEWVGPVQFNPGYCLPSVDIVHYFTQFYTTNAIDNIIITPTPGVGYVNSTSMVIGTEAGGSFNFTSNYIGGASGLRIWIDWNNDFIFEDSEEVFYQGSANGNKSGIITIPSDALSGDYRIRVRGQASADSVPSSCGQSEYGQTIDFTLSIPCGEVSSPVGSATQTFTSGSTLSDLSVDGSNLVWYSDSALTDVLDDTTLLVDGTTYYVVNLEGNCSSSSISVTVSEVLSSSDFTHFGFGYHPNPVSEVLYLRANTDIKSVVVFNMLGQELSLPIHSNNTQIDMTGLPSGNYVMSVTIEGVNKTFKIVKK